MLYVSHDILKVVIHMRPAGLLARRMPFSVPRLSSIPAFCKAASTIRATPKGGPAKGVEDGCAGRACPLGLDTLTIRLGIFAGRGQLHAILAVP